LIINYIIGSNSIPYNKKKEERYKAFGGINTKISQYLNSPLEFLNLENIDFQQPGSLNKRWGSTQYFGNSLSLKVNGLFEFIQLSGSSFLYVMAGGTFGLARNDGFTASFSGSTAGASYFETFGSSSIDGYSMSSLNFDAVTFQDQFMFCNGKDFLKSTGSTVTFFGLPRCTFVGGLTAALTPQQMVYGYTVGGSSQSPGFTGIFYYKFAWVNSYGFAGAPNFFVPNSNSGAVVAAGATKITVSVLGPIEAGLNSPLGSLVPSNFDIKGIAVFRTDSTALSISPSGDTNLIIASDVFGNTSYLYETIESQDFWYLGTVGLSAGSKAATFIDTQYSVSGLTIMNNNILPWNFYPQAPFQIGIGLTAPVGFGLTYIPSFIEQHENRLFIAGISASPSTFYFSEEGEPEHFEADFGFEVRTNDGDTISGMKSYNGNLMVFKQSSFHSVNTSALSFANWQITEVSSEYGCLSNRAVTTYENFCVFLDRKGIIEYNGANINILSTKIDPIFQRMNVSAAQKEACMAYDKQRNQILCDIPVDGATMNNLTVVYDIINQAWTTYKGYNSAITTIAKREFNTKQVFYGGYSGLVSSFGVSNLTDNGVGYTCVARSGFLTDLGNSTQKVFRRLFLDNTPQGASSALDVNLYQDYGSSIIINRTMYQNPFQSRIDFGISAKSLSVEFIMGSTYAMSLHGFTIEYRFQRAV
jgi:hypothetical protein